jgi:hypothetical protein
VLDELRVDRRSVSLRFNPAARRAVFARRWAVLDPGWDDAQDLILQIDRRGCLQIEESVAGRSGDGLAAFTRRHPHLWAREEAPVDSRRAPPKAAALQNEYETEEAARRLKKQAESDRLWKEAAERRRADAEAAQAERAMTTVAYWREHYERQALEKQKAAEAAAAEARAAEFEAALAEERAQSAGRDYSIVGGETVWRQKAKAWLLRLPEEHRWTAMLGARAQTHAVARALWDELWAEVSRPDAA